MIITFDKSTLRFLVRRALIKIINPVIETKRK